MAFVFLLLNAAAQKHVALISRLELSVLLLQSDGAVGWTSRQGPLSNIQADAFFYHGIQAAEPTPHWVFFYITGPLCLASRQGSGN